jgi:hypothetical protein
MRYAHPSFSRRSTDAKGAARHRHVRSRMDRAPRFRRSSCTAHARKHGSNNSSSLALAAQLASRPLWYEEHKERARMVEASCATIGKASALEVDDLAKVALRIHTSTR